MLKSILSAALLLTGCGLLPAIELNCVFDRELPEAVSVAGDTRQEDGAAVRVNSKNYVAAIIRFQGESSASGTLELDLKTTGQPPSRLGVILYRRNAKNALERISTPAWLKAVPIDSFGQLTFNFPAGRFKSGTEYQIYIYRANQKGTLVFRRIAFKTVREEKSITLNYRNTPDLVGPVTRGPSGKPDFHIHLTGVDPAKSIREVVVTRPGGRWVSGDDVKKNFWMIDYYDSADFPARKNPRNNFDGAVHSGLSCIDLVMEGGYSEGASYLCEVFYTDGTKDTWTAALKKPDPPMIPLFFTHKQPILAAPSFTLPEGWKQPVVCGRTYFQIMSPRDLLDRGLLMQGKTHRRVWSLGWFLPYAGLNPKPSRAMIDKYVKWSHRAALREFQVFGSDGKIVSGAKVSGSGDLKWLDLDKAVDGDTSPDSAAKAETARIGQPQTAEIMLTFPRPVKLSKAVLYHGCRNGSQIGWTAKDFVLESLQDGKWTAVPGGEVRNNRKEQTKHALGGLETAAVRLRILDENPLADYSAADWSADNALLDLKKTEKIPNDVTFHYWYLGHDSKLHYALPPDGFTPPGMEKYRKWRAKHPNFMGFQLAEFDNDLLCMLGWGSYRDQKGAKAVYDSASRDLVIQRPIPKLPDTRAEAVGKYEHLFRFYQRMMFNDCANFSSLTIWHHHPMEWGAVSTVMECFGGCPVFSLQIAAARGASRQYGNKPWGCYYATYLGHGHLNYLKNGKTYGPHGGKSASLYRRQLYYSYLTGVTYVDYEHPDIAFVTKKFVRGEKPELSPHGKAVLETAEFAERDPERGHVYTPIAVLMDWEHGWDSHEGRKIWMGMFKPTLGDRNIDVWMKGIFGNSEMPQEGYGCNMSQTGFSGLADILVLNPPSGPPRNLADYPAAIVTGSIRWNDRAARAVRDYVRNGGILLINSEQLPKAMDSSFTGVEFTGKTASGTETLTMDNRKLPKAVRPYEYRKVRLRGASVLLLTPDRQPLATVFKYGHGKVVLTLQKYLMEEPASAGQKQGLPAVHYLLSLLRQELLPFQVRGDSPAEVIAAKLKNGWRVSLLNNRGVYKQATTAPVVVPSERTVQTVSFPGRIESVTERISGKKLPVKSVNGRDQVTVTIPSGDLVVLDFVFSSK